jgi:glucose-1-phosphate thymidylyltransferase
MQTCRRTHVTVHTEETHNDDNKLGALGALAQWIVREEIQEDILLVTGDNYFGFDLVAVLDAWQNARPLVAAADVRDRARARSFGTILLDPERSTRVIGFEEKPAHPQSTIVSTGCSILPRDLLPLLIVYAQHHPDNIGGIFEEFLRRAIAVDCFVTDAPWFDIGSFAAYTEATRALVGDRVLQDEHALLEASHTTGSVVLGKRSVVRASTLHNTVLFDDCVIEDCVIENCVIDDGCVLRGMDLSGKMLRRGTRLIRSS